MSPDEAAFGVDGDLTRIRSARNLVAGMLATPEAVKPARAAGRDSVIAPQIILSDHQRLVPQFATAMIPAPVAANAATSMPTARTIDASTTAFYF